MTFERLAGLRPDHEGDAWSDKEQMRTEGYAQELARQIKKLKAQDADSAKQERVNKTARDVLKKLNIDPRILEDLEQEK